MTNVDPERLHGMLRLIVLVRGSMQGVDEQSFDANRELIDATAYCIQHIGEAARKLSQALQDRHPQLPWRLIAGMRNLLAQAYDYVDPKSVWLTSSESLDALEAMCRAELGE